MILGNTKTVAQRKFHRSRDSSGDIFAIHRSRGNVRGQPMQRPSRSLPPVAAALGDGRCHDLLAIYRGRRDAE